MSKQLVGKSVTRKEDYRLLTGKGQFVADLPVDAYETTFVRSTHAHAKIVSIDIEEALKVDGVITILTGEDLKDEIAPLTEFESHCYLPERVFNRINPILKPNHERVVATEKVIYVGQIVAVVVAESRYIAEDAANLIRVHYESLPVLVDPYESMKEDAPLIQEHLDNNIQANFRVTTGDYETAVKEADYIIKEKISTPRIASQPLETRGVVAEYDFRSDFLHVHSSTQLPFEVRVNISQKLGITEQNIRVTAPDVGGGFGPKGGVYPEEIIIAYLARKLEHPVKWIEDRLEHMMASRHSRDQIHEVEVAFNKDGRILGLKDKFVLDAGAINYFALTCAYNSVAHLRGPYKITNFDAECNIVLTNKTPNVPYRGAGRPEVCFTMDRVIDKVARKLNLDPVEVMKKNIIQAEEMPYFQGICAKDGSDLVYDSGNYPEALEMVLEMSNYEEIRKQQEAWRKEGKYIGIGISSNVEATGAGPFEGAKMTIDSTGHVVVDIGSAAQGQGHETIFAQIAADELQVDVSQVTVRCGDTGVLPHGQGTYASRSTVNAGSAIYGAAQKMKDKMLHVAAALMNEKRENCMFIRGGKIGVLNRATQVTFAQVAKAMWPGPGCLVPKDSGHEQGSHVEYYFLTPTFTFASAVHMAVVEVDIETCFVDLKDYFVVHDSGRVVNPKLLEGQVQGGIAQGIGAALLEEVVYNSSGQLLTGTYMDYLMPTALDVPEVKQGEQVYESLRNPLGVKGVGEMGPISPPAAIANAVIDALKPFNIEIDELPITPNRLYHKINK